MFLGWSLGANDAANVFGTAVGTRMVRFREAAIVASIFVILGAVVQGAGTTSTLTELGSVDALAGSFTVALSAAFVVFLMTRYRLPVSTSQAIVGAIIGWNFYTNSPTDYKVLLDIVATWVVSPVLAAVFAVLLYILIRYISLRIKMHILRIEIVIRWSLVIVGAFGAYSLGANNIANVVGVYANALQFPAVDLGILTLSGNKVLFALGGLAISIGIFTYSRRVMERIGSDIFKLNSVAAIVVVLSHGLVLFIFSSAWLNSLITQAGLPPLPLVPISSSQAVVGAILGIGLLKGGRGIKIGVMGKISLGWVITPLAAALLCFLSLFFVNNLFELPVSGEETVVSAAGIENAAGKTIYLTNSPSP